MPNPLFPLGVALALLPGSAPSTDYGTETESESDSVWSRPQWNPSLSVGFPHVLNLALDARMQPEWGLGIQGGYLVLPFGIPGVASGKISSGNIEARARWFPYSATFFVGGLLGYQSVGASGEQSVSFASAEIPTDLDFDVQGPYVTPHLGWLWSSESGFMAGLELGIQVPLFPSSRLTVSTSGAGDAAESESVTFREFKENVEDAGELFGKIPLPHFQFRVGWTF